MIVEGGEHMPKRDSKGRFVKSGGRKAAKKRTRRRKRK